MALVIGISYKNTAIEISDTYDDLHRFILYLKNIGFISFFLHFYKYFKFLL